MQWDYEDGSEILNNFDRFASTTSTTSSLNNNNNNNIHHIENDSYSAYSENEQETYSICSSNEEGDHHNDEEEEKQENRSVASSSNHHEPSIALDSHNMMTTMSSVSGGPESPDRSTTMIGGSSSMMSSGFGVLPSPGNNSIHSTPATTTTAAAPINGGEKENTPNSIDSYITTNNNSVTPVTKNTGYNNINNSSNSSNKKPNGNNNNNRGMPPIDTSGRKNRTNRRNSNKRRNNNANSCGSVNSKSSHGSNSSSSNLLIDDESFQLQVKELICVLSSVHESSGYHDENGNGAASSSIINPSYTYRDEGNHNDGIAISSTAITSFNDNNSNTNWCLNTPDVDSYSQTSNKSSEKKLKYSKTNELDCEMVELIELLRCSRGEEPLDIESEEEEEDRSAIVTSIALGSVANSLSGPIDLDMVVVSSDDDEYDDHPGNSSKREAVDTNISKSNHQHDFDIHKTPEKSESCITQKDQSVRRLYIDDLDAFDNDLQSTIQSSTQKKKLKAAKRAAKMKALGLLNEDTGSDDDDNTDEASQQGTTTTTQEEVDRILPNNPSSLSMSSACAPPATTTPTSGGIVSYGSAGPPPPPSGGGVPKMTKSLLERLDALEDEDCCSVDSKNSSHSKTSNTSKASNNSKTSTTSKNSISSKTSKSSSVGSGFISKRRKTKKKEKAEKKEKADKASKPLPPSSRYANNGMEQPLNNDDSSSNINHHQNTTLLPSSERFNDEYDSQDDNIKKYKIDSKGRRKLSWGQKKEIRAPSPPIHIHNHPAIKNEDISKKKKKTEKTDRVGKVTKLGLPPLGLRKKEKKKMEKMRKKEESLLNTENNNEVEGNGDQANMDRDIRGGNGSGDHIELWNSQIQLPKEDGGENRLVVFDDGNNNSTSSSNNNRRSSWALKRLPSWKELEEEVSFDQLASNSSLNATDPFGTFENVVDDNCFVDNAGFSICKTTTNDKEIGGDFFESELAEAMDFFDNKFANNTPNNNQDLFGSASSMSQGGAHPIPSFDTDVIATTASNNSINLKNSDSNTTEPKLQQHKNTNSDGSGDLFTAIHNDIDFLFHNNEFTTTFDEETQTTINPTTSTESKIQSILGSMAFSLGGGGGDKKETSNKKEKKDYKSLKKREAKLLESHEEDNLPTPLRDANPSWGELDVDVEDDHATATTSSSTTTNNTLGSSFSPRGINTQSSQQSLPALDDDGFLIHTIPEGSNEEGDKTTTTDEWWSSSTAEGGGGSNQKNNQWSNSNHDFFGSTTDKNTSHNNNDDDPFYSPPPKTQANNNNTDHYDSVPESPCRPEDEALIKQRTMLMQKTRLDIDRPNNNSNTVEQPCSSSRIDAVEAAAKRRIEMLRNMIAEQDKNHHGGEPPLSSSSITAGTTGGASVNTTNAEETREAMLSQLKFVEEETMKQITKVRGRLDNQERMPSSALLQKIGGAQQQQI